MGWSVCFTHIINSLSTTNTGGYTGKVSWNLGKRYGLSSCTLHLPHTDTDDNEGDDAATTTTTTTNVKKEEEVEEFWVALERICRLYVHQIIYKKVIMT